MGSHVDLGLNAVIVAVTEEVPRILTVRRAEDTLPFGPVEPDLDRTLDRGLRRWVAEQTGLPLGYVEQLYTFGDRGREPAEDRGGPRAVSVAYLALVREATVKGEASWRDWYEFFPWEDWRDGRPRTLDRDVAPALDAWVAQAPDALHRQERRERADIVFGLGGASWDGERVLERYELLYEALLVPEAWRDRGKPAEHGLPGRPMALDHRRILATALGRLRGKIKYRPVVFELLPPTFTLLQLQRVVEALAGVRLHKQNFRRLVEHGGLVEGTGQDVQTGGRPAELFGFRREVLRERPAPGVGLPGVRR
ncbi:MAG: NUDIX hydrolase [Thermoanaerobaculia bacterium]